MIRQPCAHKNAVPVESGGELVAGLCTDCDQQLPAEWFTCEHADAVEPPGLCQREAEHLCPACGASFAAPRRQIWSMLIL